MMKKHIPEQGFWMWYIGNVKDTIGRTPSAKEYITIMDGYVSGVKWEDVVLKLESK